MNPEQIRNAFKITSIFENGTTDLQYDYAEALDDYGKRGVTFSLGFCVRTGDGIQVLNKILNQNRLHPLVKYINPVQRSMDSWFYNKFMFPKDDFIADWEKHGCDPECTIASDAVYSSECATPALQLFTNLGASYSNFWTFVSLFDSIVMSGFEGTQTTIKQMPPLDLKAIPEIFWCKAFNDTRVKYMKAQGDNEWDKCLYRPDVIQKWAEANWANQLGPYSLSDINVGDFTV
jgi:chitosanase